MPKLEETGDSTLVEVVLPFHIPGVGFVFSREMAVEATSISAIYDACQRNNRILIVEIEALNTELEDERRERELWQEMCRLKDLKYANLQENNEDLKSAFDKMEKKYKRLKRSRWLERAGYGVAAGAVIYFVISSN